MGQGQSVTGEAAPQWTAEQGGWPEELEGANPGPQAPPQVVLARAAPTPSTKKLLPPSAAGAHADTTTDYLSTLIAKAEEQGPNSRHDIALLRFQLDTVRREASQRREDHLRVLRRQMEEELRQHAVQAIVLVDANPPPSSPRSKKLKQQEHASPVTPPQASNQPQSPAQSQPLPSPPEDASPPTAADDLPSSPSLDTMTLISQHQARIHAANMAIIRAQMQQQPESLESSKPRRPIPPSRSRPAPTADADASTQNESQAHPLHAGPARQETLSAPLPPSLPPSSPQSHSVALPDLPTASSDWPMETSSVSSGDAVNFSPTLFAAPHDPQLAQSSSSLDVPMTPTWTPFITPTELPPGLRAEDDASPQTPAAMEETAASSDSLSTRSSEQSSQGSSSQLPAGFERPSHSVRSRLLLDTYISNGALETLERNYSQGMFSETGVRQFLVSITSELEPDDHDELMNRFSNLSLKGCERALATRSHDDSQGAPSNSHPADILKNAAAEFEVTMDLSPSEAAPDDVDGIPRLRFNIFFSAPNPLAVKHKRKKSSAEVAEEQSGAELSVSSSAPADSHPRVYRLVQANKAFEILSGFSQADIQNSIRQRVRPHSVFAFDTLRSDHFKAVSIIETHWRLNNVTEGHIYQVRRNRDGTERYCLIHTKIYINHGLKFGAEHAIIPLPVDDAHPIPPFVEGVDLDVDTLLYGYKPLQST